MPGPNRLECVMRTALILLLTLTVGGCDQLGFSHQTARDSRELPSGKELKKIDYLPTVSGPQGRKVYEPLDKAKTCADLEVAMRWNRPPDIEGGPFNKKVVYLGAGVPADLPDNSEVFISSATIVQGDTLSSGAQAWILRLKDHSLLQAIEPTGLWQKQEQAQQDAPKGAVTAIVNPDAPGREFCAHGVYQGLKGRAPGEGKNIPLVSILFAMDRSK
jgi:hypothetical protein